MAAKVWSSTEVLLRASVARSKTARENPLPMPTHEVTTKLSVSEMDAAMLRADEETPRDPTIVGVDETPPEEPQSAPEEPEATGATPEPKPEGEPPVEPEQESWEARLMKIFRLTPKPKEPLGARLMSFFRRTSKEPEKAPQSEIKTETAPAIEREEGAPEPEPIVIPPIVKFKVPRSG